MGLQLASFRTIIEPDLHTCIERSRTHIVRVAVVDIIAPGIPPLVRAAGGFFPFGFGGQAVLLASLSTHPVAIGDGTIPIHPQNRVVIRICSSSTMVVGLGPVGDLVFRQGASTRPKLRVIVTRIVAELAPLGIGNFQLRHVEGVHFHGVDRPLSRQPVAKVITHPEHAAGNQHHLPVGIINGLCLRRTQQR